MSSQPRLCHDCQEPTGRKHARYCDRHRFLHQKRPAKYGALTPEREAFLRAHYQPDGQGRGWTVRLARRMGVPKWRLTRWAATLGLMEPTTKPPAWTPAEDAHLERRLEQGRSLEVIARELHRSLTAVEVRSKRLGISRRSCRQGFSACALALAMGVDVHKVTRWIASGWLDASRMGTARTPAQGGDEWVITEHAVRTFLREHPTAYSLRRVDQTWFLSTVFGTLGERESGGARANAA